MSRLSHTPWARVIALGICLAAPVGAGAAPVSVGTPTTAGGDDAPSWPEVVQAGGVVWSALGAPSPIAISAARRGRGGALPADLATVLGVFRATQLGSFDPLIADAAEAWRLDPFLLKGLLFTESRMDPSLIGKRIYRKRGGKRVAVGGGARGIAQFTTSGIAAINELRERRRRDGAPGVRPIDADAVMDPAIAVPAAAELLAHYIDRFGRDGGITAYNSGPYGGRLVKRQGFYRARRNGKLSSVGERVLQGHRFLVNVLRHANRFRAGAGLEPLPQPRDNRSRVERKLDELLRGFERRDRGRPNT
jgi:hypothetical protein